MRAYAQSFIQPGIDLADMCERIEECNRRLVRENGLQVISIINYFFNYYLFMIY